MQAEEGEEVAAAMLRKVCIAAAGSCRLGIFQMECSHRFNQALQASSANLGSTKTWTKMSAEAFLNSALVQHKKLMRQGQILSASLV